MIEFIQNCRERHSDWLMPDLLPSRTHTRAGTDLSVTRGALGATTARSFEQDASGRMFVTLEENPWDVVIARTIDLWSRSAEIFDEEGLEPPRPETLFKARFFAERMKANRFPAPDRIIPDASGGILFERDDFEEGIREVLHFWDEGDVEYQTFQGPKMQDRIVISNADDSEQR